MVLLRVKRVKSQNLKTQIFSTADSHKKHFPSVNVNLPLSTRSLNKLLLANYNFNIPTLSTRGKLLKLTVMSVPKESGRQGIFGSFQRIERAFGRNKHKII